MWDGPCLAAADTLDPPQPRRQGVGFGLAWAPRRVPPAGAAAPVARVLARWVCSGRWPRIQVTARVSDEEVMALLRYPPGRRTDVEGASSTPPGAAPAPPPAAGSGLRAGVVAPPTVVAVVAGGIYLVAGLTGLLSPVFPQTETVNTFGLQVLGGLSALSGAALLRWGRRLPAWSAHVLVAVGIVAVTVAIDLAGSSPTGVAIASYYIFIALDCGLFFTLWVGRGYVLVTIVVCMASLGRQDPEALGAAFTLSATALVVNRGVRWLAEKAASAEVDVLTGLPNRRHLDQALTAAVDRARCTGRPLSVALLDLDHFKAANDAHGHDHDDRLLVATTRAWRHRLRSGHLLARQGGDEFVLVLPDLDAAAAAAVVERLRRAVPAGSTCSIGVAVLAPTDTASSLTRRADVALYEAKRAGRDRVVLQAGTTEQGRASSIPEPRSPDDPAR